MNGYVSLSIFWLLVLLVFKICEKNTLSKKKTAFEKNSYQLELEWKQKIANEKEKLMGDKTKLFHNNSILSEKIKELELKLSEEASRKEKVLVKNQHLKEALLNKFKGFSILLNVIEEYDDKKDALDAFWLANKDHPAISASEKVREHSMKKRAAESAYKKALMIMEYYESVAPFLIDLKEEELDSEELSYNIKYEDYSEEEKQDAVVQFVTKEEYRTLPTSEKNQLALDRYWARKKSKQHIGKAYERYVGYVHEMEGFNVEFKGIFDGINDLGIDLVCKKKNYHLLVQCKCWSKHKSIFENHIFQFFGTTYKYRMDNPKLRVEGVFYSTTTVSDVARMMGKQLGVKIIDNHLFDYQYPCIKCNVSGATGEKIYHLPFDQMYDRVKIEEKKGEFYAATIKEAEAKGFRRAFRYLGGNS
jgi:hypothetical protein